MVINRPLLFSLIGLFVFLGLAVVIYLFGKEDLQTAYNNIVNPPSTAQEPGPPVRESIYESFLTAPIDWGSQMQKLKNEGFANSPFIADIKDLTYATKTLKLNFDFNYGGSFPDNQEVVAKADCPTETSYILTSRNLTVIAEKTDIFSLIGDEEPYVRSGDILISYCLNNACTTIGNECVLIRVESENEI